MQQALGMIETRGLVALVEATDAMLKSANVEVIGPMTQVGNAMVTVCVTGDVAAVKAATEAGRNAAQSLGEVLGTSVIARPHNELTAILPKAK
jgi:ethanolamine utilization protein EutM